MGNGNIEQESLRIYHTFQNSKMNFTAFSRCDAYRRENMELMLQALQYLPESFSMVDIGAGNGLAAQIVKGITEAFLRKAIILGIDPDPYAITQASKDTPSSRRCKVAFIEGFGQDVRTLVKGKVPEKGVDMVSILDAVHEFPADDQLTIVKAGASILKENGIFIMNSTFTSIATEDNPNGWAMPPGRAGIKFGGRKSGQTGLLLRNPQEYTQMLSDAGLQLVYYHISDVTLPTEALVAISQYPGFVEGVRKSFVFDNPPSLEELSQELQLRYGKCKPMTRKWVRWIAQKPWVSYLDHPPGG